MLEGETLDDCQGRPVDVRWTKPSAGPQVSVSKITILSVKLKPSLSDLRWMLQTTSRTSEAVVEELVERADGETRTREGSDQFMKLTLDQTSSTITF